MTLGDFKSSVFGFFAISLITCIASIIFFLKHKKYLYWFYAYDILFSEKPQLTLSLGGLSSSADRLGGGGLTLPLGGVGLNLPMGGGGLALGGGGLALGGVVGRRRIGLPQLSLSTSVEVNTGLPLERQE